MPGGPIQSGHENTRKSWENGCYVLEKSQISFHKISGYLRWAPWSAQREKNWIFKMSCTKDIKSSCIPNIQQDDWSSQDVGTKYIIAHYSLHWKSAQWKFETEVTVIAGFKPSEFWVDRNSWPVWYQLGDLVVSPTSLKQALLTRIAPNRNPAKNRCMPQENICADSFCRKSSRISQRHSQRHMPRADDFRLQSIML